MRFWFTVSVLFLLTACSKPATLNKADDAAASAQSEVAAVAAPSSAAIAQAQATEAAATNVPSTTAPAAAATPAAAVAHKTPHEMAQTPPEPSAPQLAYKYDYGVRLPAARIRGMLDLDQQDCQAAGPSVCQVTGTSLQGVGGDVLARLDLRATEPWLSRFRADIAAQAEDFGGQVIKANLDGQDLSGSIADAKAGIRTQATLRNRVQRLFERPGKLTDVMASGQELARAQGDLDTNRAQLADLRNRVAMSRLSINYQAENLVMASLGRLFFAWPVAAFVALAGWLALRANRKQIAKTPPTEV